MNKGKVLVGADDSIYYVFRHVPRIQKYSLSGELQFDIKVSGDAINIQQEVADKALRNSNAVGVDILTSAAIDYETSHLWVSMNGSSTTGILYVYSAAGEKIREFALEYSSSASSTKRITGIRDIAISNSRLHVITQDHSVYSFNTKEWRMHTANKQVGRSNRNTFSGFNATFLPSFLKSTTLNRGFDEEPPCGQTQQWGACSVTCNSKACQTSGMPPNQTCQPTATSSTDNTSIDCKALLDPNDQNRVIGSSCTSPNSYPRGGASCSVTRCVAGVPVTSTASPECPTPTCTPQDCGTGGGGGGECDFEVCNEGCHWNSTECQCLNNSDYQPCYGSPIVIDVNGNGFDLTSATEGVNFDLQPGGTVESFAWTAQGSDDAWLTLDRNNNGMIDNGAELFGNFTFQPRPPHGEERNGFLALAEFDKRTNGGNRDGQIDVRDAVFPRLRLWQDLNHNGISEPNELRTLLSLGLAILDLDYKESRRVDQHGNRFKYRAKVRDTRGAQIGRWAWDVFLVRGQ